MGISQTIKESKPDKKDDLPGLFLPKHKKSFGDKIWQCTHCAHTNGHKRTVCQTCNKPRKKKCLALTDELKQKRAETRRASIEAMQPRRSSIFSESSLEGMKFDIE